MLVLSRKHQEQILIPGLNITITVLKVGAQRVQLGIAAPADVQITRPERMQSADLRPREEPSRPAAECHIAT